MLCYAMASDNYLRQHFVTSIQPLKLFIFNRIHLICDSWPVLRRLDSSCLLSLIPHEDARNKTGINEGMTCNMNEQFHQNTNVTITAAYRAIYNRSIHKEK